MAAPTSLDHLNTLADSTRSRLLLVLERHELTVGELCAILQLPQSTISRHLKLLGDEEWVSQRAEGTSRYYRAASSPDEWAYRLWSVVRDDVLASMAAQHDGERALSVLAARRARSREYFRTAAGEWDELRAELFGDRFDAKLVCALLDPAWVVGDLGCGAGHLLARLAPHVARVVGIDGSEEMLGEARARLASFSNAMVQQGELEQLPLPDESLDVALMSLALQHVADPLRAITDARRVLRPGGRLVIVDVLPHDNDDLQQRLGQVWRGFSAPQVHEWLREGGFINARYASTLLDDTTRGPGIFIAQGRRPSR